MTSKNKKTKKSQKSIALSSALMLGTPAPNFTLRSAPDLIVSLEEFRSLKQRIFLSLMARVLFPRRAREKATSRTRKGIAKRTKYKSGSFNG
jgi:hypothetical protein